MLSIPQNIKVETKKVIEKEIYNKFKHILDETMDNLFYNFSPSKYVSNILNLNRDMGNTILELIKLTIKTLDNLFCNSKYRKANFYLNKKQVPRTIVTIWGELIFNRNFYTDKNKKNGFFLIDELFEFEKYKSYDQVVRALLIDESVRSNTNKACNNSMVFNFNILNYLKKSNIPDIPRQTIYNWIQQVHIPNVKYDPKEVGKTLYIMADEKYIHEQIRKAELDGDEKNKKHFIMSKCFVVFTGAKTRNKRTKLLNKHIFITASKTPWKDFMDEICKIYDFEKVETINLLSDCGNWILAGKDELKLYTNNNIVVNTCEFHVKQKINRMTTDKELRTELYNIIYEQEDKKEFIKKVDKLIELKPKRKDKLTEYKNYIVKHWHSIINMKYCGIKSSMESHISHCVAEHFGSRPKAYSQKRIEKYIKLQEYKLNNINILDLLLKSSYQNDDFVYNEKELDFSIFDKSNSFLPVKSSRTLYLYYFIK